MPESQTAILVNHIWNCEQKYGPKTMCADFIGIIEEQVIAKADQKIRYVHVVLKNNKRMVVL